MDTIPSSFVGGTSDMKGKARADSQGFEDLNPTITYRHLLSQNMGVKSPLRVVALCDSDAFYAACEHVRLNIDPALPLVVLQWNALIAVNYPARKFGISRMDKLEDAKKRCPDLIVVHVATYAEGETEPKYWDKPDTHTHKVSLDLYRRESLKIITMFKEGLPNGEVEKASIDEAFIDFTVPVRDVMLERYPYLSQVPHDAPDGIDSPLPPPPPVIWTGLGSLIPIEPFDCVLDDDEEVDGEDAQTTWHDVALSIAAELMQKIREDILSTLGYSTSAGIARNKFLAKLTASYKKPMSQSILRNAAIPGYLRPMAFQKIRFLGGKLGSAIADEYDVKTVGDLLTIGLEEMQRKFGEGSIWVYEVLRGIDRSEVKEKPAINKSMLASKNLQTPILKPSEGPHWIRVLAAELTLRLNDARDLTAGLWPKTLVLHIREGYNAFRSKQTAFPFIRNVSIDHIASAGDKLWKELVGTDSTRKVPLKITNVQLAFTGIGMTETGQKKIEGFFRHGGSGSEVGEAGSSTEFQLKREAEREMTEMTDSPRRLNYEGAEGGSSIDNTRGDSKGDDNAYSFICERCGKKISLTQRLSGSSASDPDDEDGVRKAFGVLKLEHDDYHFAQDLARSAGTFGEQKQRFKSSRARSTSPIKPNKRKKDKEKDDNDRNKHSQGIAKFLVRKVS